MRWLFYLLLALNALVFGRELQHLEPPAPATTPKWQPSTVNRLLLLSELESGALRERRARPAPAASAVVESEPAPPPVEAPPVAPAGPGETLSTTLEAAVTAALQGFEPAPSPLITPAPAARRCYSIGPLEKDEDITRMREWLQARGGEPRLREDERRELTLYWVHFPPLPDRKAAIARVERMRAEGIDDIFIIPGGDMRNAVSLGVYSRPESLERRLRELREKGYDPSVVNRYRTSVAAWFDVSLPATFTFDGEEFATRFPGAQIEPLECT